MKAVIMAGGEGTRLRPLTCDLPKPMVQVLGRPVMAYAVELLKKHGITDMAATLHFMPDAIRDHFGDGASMGVSMRYFVEDTPLGTAGSVRAARGFLDETFVVISGDALTDIDLGLAAQFHREKRSDVTIVLKSVEIPVDFGVVISGADGRIERFMEKPAWRDVFSDTVNTGIYIIEPQVMDRVAEGVKTDFSKDLFPALMASGARMYGYPAEGYWCDIGNPQQYAAAQFDMLDGRVHADFGLPELRPGVFVHPQARVAEGTALARPCAVMEGATLEDGCAVGPYAVIGRGCAVERGAYAEYSVLLDGARAGTSSHLERCIVCEGAIVGDRARVLEGAVLGAGVRLGADSAVGRSVSLWPGITVERHATVRSTLQRAGSFPRELFSECGISGAFNDDISAESAARIAMALGSAHKGGARVGVAVWGDNAAGLLREAFDAGLLSAGVCCVDMGKLSLPAARFAARRLRLDGAVHILSSGGQISIAVMDGKGADADAAFEKKVEDNLSKGAFRRARNCDIEEVVGIGGIAAFYEQELFGGGGATFRDGRIGVYGPDEELNQQAERMLSGMGYECSACSTDATAEEAAKHAMAENAKVGLFQRDAGNDFSIIDEQGGVHDGDKLAVMLAMAAMDRGMSPGTVPLPVMANAHFEEFAAERGMDVERTPAGRSDWLRRACLSRDERMCHLFYDGVYAAMSLAETLAQEHIALSAYAARVPETFTSRQYAECPPEKRGLAMKELYTRYGNSESYGGALIASDKGRVFVAPEKQSSRFSILAEAASVEFAEELALAFKKVIDGIAGGKDGHPL
jgi:mannose-1-phosphate guanylyltransferase/phosphomannomutase